MSKTPMSRATEGTEGAPPSVAEARPVRSAAIFWAMTSISWSVRPAMAHLFLPVFLDATDFPGIDDRHDDGVARALVGHGGLPRRTAGAHEHEFTRPGADGVDRDRLAAGLLAFGVNVLD